jgi:ATP-binding cassette, subfamily C, bacterial
VVIISHRPNALGVVDKLLVMKEGTAELFGPRNEVIGQLTRLASVKPVGGGAAAQAKVAQ